jgi:hypothetical protein
MVFPTDRHPGPSARLAAPYFPVSPLKTPDFERTPALNDAVPTPSMSIQTPSHDNDQAFASQRRTASAPSHHGPVAFATGNDSSLTVASSHAALAAYLRRVSGKPTSVAQYVALSTGAGYDDMYVVVRHAAERHDHHRGYGSSISRVSDVLPFDARGVPYAPSVAPSDSVRVIGPTSRQDTAVNTTPSTRRNSLASSIIPRATFTSHPGQNRQLPPTPRRSVDGCSSPADTEHELFAVDVDNVTSATAGDVAVTRQASQSTSSWRDASEVTPTPPRSPPRSPLLLTHSAVQDEEIPRSTASQLAGSLFQAAATDPAGAIGQFPFRPSFLPVVQLQLRDRFASRRSVEATSPTRRAPHHFPRAISRVDQSHNTQQDAVPNSTVLEVRREDPRKNRTASPTRQLRRDLNDAVDAPPLAGGGGWTASILARHESNEAYERRGVELQEEFERTDLVATCHRIRTLLSAVWPRGT